MLVKGDVDPPLITNRVNKMTNTGVTIGFACALLQSHFAKL